MLRLCVFGMSAILVSSFIACASDDGSDDGSATTASGPGDATTTGATGGEGGGMPRGGPSPTLADCETAMGGAAELALEEVVTGLTKPMMFTHAPGDAERGYIVLREGQVLLLRDGATSEFLDVNDDTEVVESNQGGDERGLLGLAFHPNYAENGRFFVHYSRALSDPPVARGPGEDVSQRDHEGVVMEYRRSGDHPDVADPVPVREVIAFVQPARNHNGGSLEFSPVDGLLYLGLGDGGRADDDFDQGQDQTTVLGALLRLDVDGDAPFTVPAGNLDSGAREIFQYGLRNPYRFSFDLCNGDLYIGDVGQNAWEEINVAPAAPATTVNWGWPTLEAEACFRPNTPENDPTDCDGTGLTAPAFAYPHDGSSSVTGGVVYRGASIPWLRGTYFFADFARSQFWTLRTENQQLVGEVTEVTQQLTAGLGLLNPSGFGNDARGEVYVTDYTQGRLLRVVAAP
ncbi:MAG: PQQ-dependent sugar dehydrogenase [Myxococcota bacterium]